VEEGDTGKWVSVDQHVQQLADESWSTYWAEMSANESLEFLQDPKKELVGTGLIGDDFRVQAHVINSDVAMPSGPVCTLLLVFPREKLAHLTVYRHPPEG